MLPTEEDKKVLIRLFLIKGDCVSLDDIVCEKNCPLMLLCNALKALFEGKDISYSTFSSLRLLYIREMFYRYNITEEEIFEEAL